MTPYYLKVAAFVANCIFLPLTKNKFEKFFTLLAFKDSYAITLKRMLVEILFDAHYMAGALAGLTHSL